MTPNPCPRCGSAREGSAADPRPCPACGAAADSAAAETFVLPDDMRADPSPAGPPADPEAPAPGDATFGRYRLLRRLGAGGMGVVWLAHDPQLGRDVALKTLHPPAGDVPELTERFLREARLAARLRHPGLVAVYDVGEERGKPYLAMELVTGRTLEQALAESRSPRLLAGWRPDPELLRREISLLADVADAVGYAHREGVLHRDLKPGNVLIDGDGRVRVGDFGLAREFVVPGGVAAAERLRTLTQAGDLMGTPAYMSPEQIAALPAKLGPPSDVWALGVMLYETLAGRLPFVAPTAWEVLEAAVSRDPVPPRWYHPALPLELDWICGTALEKDPARRYADAGEFGADLRRWLRGEAVLAGPPSRTRRLGTWAKRRRWGIAVALALATALALGAAGVRARRETEAARTNLRRSLVAWVAELETRTRQAELTPEGRRELAQQSLGRLDTAIRDEPGYGPGFAWRGRLLVLLDDPAAGETDFDRACTMAPRNPVVWYLRGLSRVERYAQEHPLPGHALLTFGGVRATEAEPESDVAQRLREDALRDLAAVGGADQPDETFSPAYLSEALALLALYRGTTAGYEEVLVRIAGRTDPAARRLHGLALFQLLRFDEAIVEFDGTLADWPHDFLALTHRGESWRGRAWRDGQRGADPRAALGRALADFEHAARLRPDLWGPWTLSASALRGIGEADAARGGDPRPRFLEAEERLTHVISMSGASASPWVNRGNVRLLRGIAEEARGGDPLPIWLSAREDYRKVALQLADHAESRWGLAAVLVRIACLMPARGQDPARTLAAAVETLDQAAKHDPHAASARAKRASTLLEVAEVLERIGAPVEPTLLRAREDLDAAAQMEPENAYVRHHRGVARFVLAQKEIDAGRDGRREAREAAEELEVAVRLDPCNADAWEAMGATWRLIARDQAARGEDPRDAYGRARAAYDEALGRNPAHGKARMQRGILRATVAADQRQRGQDPAPELAGAAADFSEALRVDARLVTEALRQRGHARLVLGEVQAYRGEEGRPALAAAAADLAEAARRDPRDRQASVFAGRAHASIAQLTDAAGGDPTASWRAAIAAFDTALAGAPDALPVVELRGRVGAKLCMAVAARGGDARDAAAAAIADLDRCLEKSPQAGGLRAERGRAHEVTGDVRARLGLDARTAWQAAEADYRAAQSAGGADVRFRLGAVCESLGRLDEALTWFEACGRDPEPAGAVARRRADKVRAALEAGSK